MKLSPALSVRAMKHGIMIEPHTRKASLIRQIQRKEGHLPCFRTGEQTFCKKQDCEWSSECKDVLIAAWKRT